MAEIPNLTPDEVEGMRDVWVVLDAHDDELNEVAQRVARAIPAFQGVMAAMTPQQQEESRRESREMTRRALAAGDWEVYLAHVHQQGEFYAHLDISFGAWFELLGAWRKPMLDLLHARYGTDMQRFLRATHALDRYLGIAMGAVGQAYLQAKETIILQQRQAMLELSTPVLQVRSRLLILPVVGVIDTARARQLTEALLREIRARRARVAVMDVTGVPIVDSKVANHLVQAVHAARLMGAQVILTGISPGIAQTLVSIGAEMREVRTLGDLQSGLEEAESILGYTVAQRGAG